MAVDERPHTCCAQGDLHFADRPLAGQTERNFRIRQIFQNLACPGIGLISVARFENAFVVVMQPRVAETISNPLSTVS